MPILPVATPDRRTRTLPRTSGTRTPLLSGGVVGASKRVSVGVGNHVVVATVNNVTVNASPRSP